jgi:tryptophan synthase alpha chain
LRSGGRIGLLPFVPAGYPDLATTRAILPALERGGASAIEIGIPFSDPIADGPTIQEAFSTALSHKLKLRDIFAAVSAVRGSVSIPLIAMTSYSIVYRYGLERFLGDASGAGFNGLILPDLPPPESEGVCQKIQAAGLDTILLVAPTTGVDRRQEIARLSSGFVYYMSVSGITGARDQLPEDLEQNVRQLRQMTQVPVCVGFGISKPEHVAQLATVADGAIVGSAFVKRIKEHLGEGHEAVAGVMETYCRELLSQVR